MSIFAMDAFAESAKNTISQNPKGRPPKPKPGETQSEYYTRGGGSAFLSRGATPVSPGNNRGPQGLR